MDKITLTQRNYLGIGNLLVMKNLETGELTYSSVPDQVVTDLLDSNITPTQDGYVFENLSGGTDLFDTPTMTLGIGEYADKGNGVSIVFIQKGILPIQREVDSSFIVNGEIDPNLIN